MTLHNILLIVAVVCFVLSVVGIKSRLNLTSLGLAFFAGSFLIIN